MRRSDAFIVAGHGQLFLQRMAFKHGVKRGHAKGFTHLDGTANTKGLHAGIKETFEEVVHRIVRVCRGQDWPCPLLSQRTVQPHSGVGFPGTGGALNQGEPLLHGGFHGRSL